MNRLRASILLVIMTLSLGAAEALRPYYGAAPGALGFAQRRLQEGDATLQSAYKKLLTDADKALEVTPPSVVEKKKIPPSGNVHDYQSLAPYFWPDPTKPQGLPYLRRDGEVNPECRQLDASDVERLRLVGSNVEVLGLAYYFSHDEKYAAHAARFLRTWFLDAKTCMTPHLAYAQAVLGVNEGRGTGILDGLSLAQAIDAAVLLSGSKAWTPADQTALDAWAGAYFTWLTTSSAGQEEGAAKNNHGTWYDVQKVRLALALGRTEVAQKTLQEALAKRLPVQVEIDGRQPLELARTTSFHYSCFNLKAWTELAVFGEYVQVDVWHYHTADGRHLRQALEFLLPYVGSHPKPWPYPQIHAMKPEDLFWSLRRGSQVWAAPAYEKLLEELAGKTAKRLPLLVPLGLPTEPSR